MGQLDELKKQEMFSMPQGYFENFSVELEKKIASEREQKRVFFPMRVAVAAASLALLLLAGAGVFFNKKRLSVPDESVETYYILSQVDESVLLDYYLTESDFDVD